MGGRLEDTRPRAELHAALTEHVEHSAIHIIRIQGKLFETQIKFKQH
jgi:hypothetical protein